MSTLAYKTRGQSSPQGKPRVFFCCHPEDFQPFFQEIADNILKMQNCAIWYFTDQQATPDDEQMETDLGQMQLFVVPVTAKLLHLSNFAADAAIPFALKQHIPVLPLMQESGLDELFCHKFGDIQFLDKRKQDPTAISYEEKLEKYLSSVLVGDELAAKVRAAFGAYIFMSYRKKDRKYAQILMRKIHANEFCRDIAIWYDEFLTPGENFNQAIADALQKSQQFTLVITPNLINETNYVMTTEYPAAMASGKPILPAELVKTDRGILERCYTDIPDCIDAYNKGALSESLFQAVQQLALPENSDSPEHNFLIGLAYLGGIDVEVDHKRARMLIQSAAETGFVEAIKKLVSMYRTGEGVERNYRMSIRWQETLIELLRKQFDAENSEKNILLLANAYWSLGDYQYELWNLKKAKSSYLDFLQFVESVQYQFPQMKGYVSIGYLKVGKVLRTEGALADAFEYCEKSLQIAEQLAADAKNVKTRRNLSFSYDNVGAILQEEGKTEDAFQYYKKALNIRKQLASETGTIEAQNDLSSSYSEIGTILQMNGNLEDALQYYKNALSIRKQLMAETSTLDAQRSVASSYHNIGTILQTQGKLEDALQYYKNALGIQEQLVTKTRIAEVRSGMASNYNDIGMILQEKGDLEDAAQYYKKALNMREQLAAETGTPKARNDEANSCFKLGNLGQGNISYLRRALELWTQLTAECPQVARYQKNKEIVEKTLQKKLQTVTRESEPTVEAAQAAEAPALSYLLPDELICKPVEDPIVFYKAAAEKYEQSSQMPDKSDDLKNLAISYGCLADACLRVKDSQAAVIYYRWALQAGEKLARAKSTTGTWDNVGVTAYKLGFLEKDSIKYLEYSLRVWDTLKQAVPDNPRYIKCRNIVKEELEKRNLRSAGEKLLPNKLEAKKRSRWKLWK